MIVIFGTTRLATAFTSLAPSLIMPACSGGCHHEAGHILQEYQRRDIFWLQFWQTLLVCTVRYRCASHHHLPLPLFAIFRWLAAMPTAQPSMRA